MAEVTNIAWTDSTFNPWIGCTKVGPGCDHCYAEALDKRHRWQGDTHWGLGKPRMRTSASNWRKPLTWQKHAENGLLPDGKTPHGGRRPRVFCASLADVMDNEVSDDWRFDLIELVKATPGLDWLFLTKRIGLARAKPWFTDHPNVWIGATIVNQEEADRDVPKLLATPATIRFVSYEPALGPVDWLGAMCGYDKDGYRKPLLTNTKIDWIIVGGESQQSGKPRFFDLRWATSTIEQARSIGAVPFVKQLGSGHGLKDRAGADPAEWLPHLRVQEFPRPSKSEK